MKSILTVYFIAGTQDVKTTSLPAVLEQALAAGITCFQYREKGENSLKSFTAIKEMALTCQSLCRAYHVPFFVNDNVDLALEIGADGIHVGQDDLAICEVTHRCFGKLMIGLSVNTIQEAILANKNKQIDYLGLGPIFATNSKKDAKSPGGTSLITAVRSAGVTAPLVAIGGITTENAPLIRDAGADGVAVISAITCAKSLAESINKLQL